MQDNVEKIMDDELFSFVSEENDIMALFINRRLCGSFTCLQSSPKRATMTMMDFARINCLY